MYEINIDENGYYAKGNEGTLVKVTDIPDVPDVRLLKAYKYTDGILKKDVEKYAEVEKKIGNEITLPTSQERLDAMESAILELAEMLGGVQNG